MTTIVVLGVAALVLASLIGGLLKVHSQSTGYERAVDRSYAAQIRVVVDQSNRLGRDFHALLASMSGETRTSLEVSLDTLVRSADAAARQAATAASPAPAGGAGGDVTVAMTDRAAAMRALRSTVDRLLGLEPLVVAGAPNAGHAGKLPRPLSAAGAAEALAKVGTLLSRSDRSYDVGRQVLQAAPGHAVLPSSVWSGRTAAWTSAGTLAMVDALTRSPTLVATRRVELVGHTLALTPAPVPSPAAGATQGVAVVPPTGRLGVSVVVANDGDVAERGIVVRAAIGEPAGAGGGAGGGGSTPPATGTGAGGTSGAARPGRSRRISLTPHSSETVTLPSMRVAPGHRYVVAVTVVPPLPDSPGAATSDTVSVRIAPPGPPTVGQLLPAKGPGRGGTDVTILGSGFTWVKAVTFGSTPSRFKVVSSTQITAIAPPGTGTVDVHVTNPGGASATSVADRFRYRHK